jgi:hypothetical protein
MSKVSAALPAKLWIGTYEWPVKVVPKTHPVMVATENDPQSDGITLFEDEDRCIYIASHLDTRKRFEVVWHEITHAINWVNDIDDDTDEETVADRHGVAWTQFLLDNPAYERWQAYMLKRIRRERSKGETNTESKDDTETERVAGAGGGSVGQETRVDSGGSRGKRDSSDDPGSQSQES